MDIIRVVHLILCCEIRSLKYKRVHSSNWHLPFIIQQLDNKFTLQLHHNALSPRFIYIYIYITHFSSLTTLISLHFETGEFWCREEGHRLKTLHPTRPGPNLFYVGEEDKPGWGHYSIEPRRGGGLRSLSTHLLEILALKIDTIETC